MREMQIMTNAIYYINNVRAHARALKGFQNTSVELTKN